MEGTTIFFEHYRISNQYDGSRTEIGRIGPAIIYKASDLRSGAPVALTLLPVATVDPEARSQFEEKARAAQQLDHINIAKVLAFGVADDQFAFVSEYPQGETVASWISAHGPIPPDAVLRIALQVVSALGAGSFYGLTHPAIQPSNLMIVPGQTIEGGWPFIKLMNFGLAGLKLAPGAVSSVISEFASPEQLQQGTVDFRSEIYSLGATLCFLLTGAFYSAEPRSGQTKRFARPLRKLIAPMLQEDPDERPQDPMLFTQALRSCLEKVERRQALQQKLGIPFIPVVAKRPQKPVRVRTLEKLMLLEPAGPAVTAESSIASRTWLPRRALVFAAILLALAAVVTAALLPAPVSLILHRNREQAGIGVPIGVPDASSSPVRSKTSPAAVPPSASVKTQSIAQNTSSPPTPVQTPAVVNSAQNTPPISAPPPPTYAFSPGIAVWKGATAQTSAATRSLISPADQSASQAAQKSTAESAQPSPKTNPIAPSETDSSPAGKTAATEEASQETRAPREGPQTVWERMAGADGKLKVSKREAEAKADVASDEVTEQSGDENNDQANSSSRSRPNKGSQPNEVVSKVKRRSMTASERERYFQTPPRRTASLRSPLRESTFRARLVGTTPGGNLILRLPSGRTVIVPARPDSPPRRNARRVVIERWQPVYQPPQPFLPMYPSGD